MRLQPAALLLTLFLLALGLAAPSYVMSEGFAEDFPGELLKKFSAEQPLAQKDIDAFIKMYPELSPDEDLSDGQARAVLQKHGFTLERGSFVMFKIINALSILHVSPDNPDKAREMLKAMEMPEVLLPSDAELALVKGSMNKLLALDLI